MLLVSCSLDRDKLTNPNLPYWTTHLEIPLMTQSIGIDEMMADIDDTSIIKIPLFDDINGESILYAFQDTIVQEPSIITLDTGIDPAYDGMTDSMGTIKLDNIPETEIPKFLLREINSSLSSDSLPFLQSFLLRTIEKEFVFEDFTEATFQNGSLNIIINNQLPFDLENIRVKLKNQLNGVYIDSTLIDKVESKQTGEGIIYLEGKTLPKNILVEVDGESPGSSSPVNVDIDNDYFVVIINGSNLIVNQAVVAKIPYQEAIIDSGSITLSNSNNKLASASFNKGSLRMKIDSEFDLSIRLKMKIKNIQNASNQYDTWEINLDRKSSVDTIFSLKEKKLVLYSGDNFEEFIALPQDITYSYDIELEEVNGQIANDERIIAATDKIVISFIFYGDDSDSSISFSQITGKIAEVYEDIGPINQSPPSLPEEIDDFLLLDEYVEMALNIQMDNIGIPIIVNLEIKPTRSDSTLKLEPIKHNIAEQGPYIAIPRAADIINFRPESIVVTGNAVVGNNNDFTTLNVVNSILMQSYFIINIPFVFRLASGSQIKLDPELTSPESFKSLPVDIEDIKSMQILIDYDNQFDFGADIIVLAASDTAHFADSSSVKPDTLIKSLFLDNNVQSKDSLLLNEKQMKLFSDSLYVKTNVNIFGDEIFFLSTDSLILKLSASMEYLINAPDSTGTPDE